MSDRRAPEGETALVPDKLYFRIGEVARLVGVKPYVLRYWESEFSILRPEKSSARHRLYRRKDVETLLEIRRLLYTERYTIEGAKRRLRDSGRLRLGRAAPATAAPARAERPTEERVLDGVRDELLALYRMLEHDPPSGRAASARRK